MKNFSFLNWRDNNLPKQMRHTRVRVHLDHFQSIIFYKFYIQILHIEIYMVTGNIGIWTQ